MLAMHLGLQPRLGRKEEDFPLQFQWIRLIPSVHQQVSPWALPPALSLTLLPIGSVTDLYRLCGDQGRETEAYQMHCNFSQMLLKDHFQSSQMAEHKLINWTEGGFPVLLGNPAGTSGPLL